MGATGVGRLNCPCFGTVFLFDSDDAIIRRYVRVYGSIRFPGLLVRLLGMWVMVEGQLSEAVRRPCSVVLLDEVEKAHPDVF
jgi:ATP-dependent Clp protease ATP-binding subunit ClpB